MPLTIARRQLIQSGLAAAAMAARPGIARAATPGDVIVIGAGMAGLAAARTLATKGHKVTVLEARDRIGGRVHTSRLWADTPMDLGASWIHGITGNPLSRLADQAGARRLPTASANTVLVQPGGSAPGNAFDALVTKAENLVTGARARANVMNTDVSLEAAVVACTKGVLPTGQARVALDYYVNSIIEQEYAASWDQLSAWNYDDDGGFGGTDVFFPQGYDQLATYVARGLDVRTGSIVTHVRYGAGGVTVTTSTATYTAARAIVTLPLGVLQSGGVVFDPPLPADKQAAIAGLGMGLLNKCYLRFPAAFWPGKIDWIEYLTSNKGVWAEWISFLHGPNLPILVGFNAGRPAHAIEALSDADTVAGAMGALRDMFGSSIPDPTGYQITRWARDPYALGSYSFEPVGASAATRVTLAKPAGKSLFFAGEATHAQYPATVHGAYLSGVRAAAQAAA